MCLQDVAISRGAEIVRTYVPAAQQPYTIKANPRRIGLFLGAESPATLYVFVGAQGPAQQIIAGGVARTVVEVLEMTAVTHPGIISEELKFYSASAKDTTVTEVLTGWDVDKLAQEIL